MARPVGGQRIDRSFLGESALRLARLLGVGGLISPQFNSEETLQPVVLVGDATSLGYRGQALRAFAYGETVPAGGAGNTSKLVIKAPTNGRGLVIDRLYLSSGTTGIWRVSQMGSEDPDPFAIAQTNARWSERLATANGDLTGIFTTPHNTDGLSYGIDALLFILGANQPLVPIPVDFMLAPGAKLIITHTTANIAINVSFSGRAL